MEHLTSRWASLADDDEHYEPTASDPVWRASLLITSSSSRPGAKDDLLGAFIHGLGTDMLSGSAQRMGGNMVSIIVRYQAPDQATAERFAQAARRSAMSGGAAQSADQVVVSRGRLSASERAFLERPRPEHTLRPKKRA